MMLETYKRSIVSRILSNYIGLRISGVERTALVLALATAQMTGQSFVVTNVTVIDPGSARVSEHSNVVVNGRTITAIQPSGDPLPKLARRINGSGKFLIPGLWDSHVHLTKTGPLSLSLYVANGVTGVRDMGSDFQEIVGCRKDMDQVRDAGEDEILVRSLASDHDSSGSEKNFEVKP